MEYGDTARIWCFLTGMLLLTLLMLADTSRTYLVATAPGESLSVTEAGEGRAVVLIPGLFGSAHSFRKVVPRLTALGYRAVVIEPLGVGFSAKPPRGDYSLTAQADRVGRVLDQILADSAILVAHSVGGSVALRLAYRRPELVRGVVLLDGGPTETAATRGVRRAARFIPWVKWLGGINLIRKKMRSSLVEESGDTTWVSDEVVAGYTAGAAADIDGSLKAFLALANAREPEKLAPNLPRIGVPVLFLTGSVPHPGTPSRSEMDLLTRSLPRFSGDTVAGAGMWLQEERPEAVVDAVNRVSGGG